MSFQITYKLLFQVKVKHLYFQSLGNKSWNELDEAEQKKLSNKFDVAHFFNLFPSISTRELFRGHKMIFKSTATGFSVYASADPGNPTMPLIDQEGLKLVFFIQLNDTSFPNYSSLPLQNVAGKIYYFGSADSLFPALSLPYPDFVAGESYEAESFVTFSGKKYTAVENLIPANVNPDQANSGWKLIDEENFVSAANLLPMPGAAYTLKTSTGNASIVVTDKEGNELISDTYNGSDNEEYSVDLSLLPVGKYHLKASLPDNSVIEAFDFYSAGHNTSVWGVIEIFIEKGNQPHMTLNSDGSFKSKHVYELNFKNRFTKWRYLSNKDQTIIEEFSLKPLTHYGYVEITLNGAKVPNPESRIIKQEAENNISEIFID